MKPQWRQRNLRCWVAALVAGGSLLAEEARAVPPDEPHAPAPATRPAGGPGSPRGDQLLQRRRRRQQPAAPPADDRLLPPRSAVGPFFIAVEAAVAIGLFASTEGKVGFAAGLRLLRHIELAGVFRFGFGDHLLSFSSLLKLGGVFSIAPRWELLLGWRVGYVAFRADFYNGVLWTGAVATGPLVEIKYEVLPRLELRFAPLVGTGYWNELWGFVLEPSVGGAWRF